MSDQPAQAQTGRKADERGEQAEDGGAGDDGADDLARREADGLEDADLAVPLADAECGGHEQVDRCDDQDEGGGSDQDGPDLAVIVGLVGVAGELDRRGPGGFLLERGLQERRVGVPGGRDGAPARRQVDTMAAIVDRIVADYTGILIDQVKGMAPGTGRDCRRLTVTPR